MERPLITVFTPSYNRRALIEKCYRSLQRQTVYDFLWLIVDDGSSDNTEEAVNQWRKEEKRFVILYDYKQNGGLHTAYNRGIELADTELFVCIDSDDYMPDDAIERISHLWNSIRDKNYVGIMGLDFYENGQCVGGKFPQGVNEMFLYEKLVKYKIPGDKKMIHRTELLKKVAPMPSFPGEKNFNPSYMMYQLDQFGKLYTTNECYCIVDYQPDGMSSNIYKQYLNSPNSFAETRKLYLSFPGTSWKFKMRHSIHLGSSCILAGDWTRAVRESPHKWIAVLALPFSFALSYYIRLKTK